METAGLVVSARKHRPSRSRRISERRSRRCTRHLASWFCIAPFDQKVFENLKLLARLFQVPPRGIGRAFRRLKASPLDGHIVLLDRRDDPPDPRPRWSDLA